MSLRARQVLIAFQQPPYEQRHNQMESMFLSAIDMYGHRICHDSLQKLILSETSIFDVLHSFFSHPNIQVRQAALEVYVRRSYIAYELNSVQHYTLSTNDSLVEFQLKLPTTHPNRLYHNNNPSLPRAGSTTSIHNLHLDPNLIEMERVGVMAAYDDWEKATNSFDELLTHFSNSQQNELNLYNRFNSSPRSGPNSAHSSPEITDPSADSSKNASGLKVIDPVRFQKTSQFQNESMDFDMLNNNRHARKVKILV